MKQYHITLPDGTRQGPLTEAQIQDQYSRGELPANTMVWTEGMAQWAPITTIAGSGQPTEGAPALNPAFNNPFKALKYSFTHITVQGRAPLREYWMSVLGLLLCAVTIILAAIIIPIIGGIILPADLAAAFSLIVGGLAIVLYVLLAISSLLLIPVAVRRFHDQGLSGWWLLIGIIPGIGALLVLICLCLDSKPGPNMFGPNPKGR